MAASVAERVAAYRARKAIEWPPGFKRAEAVLVDQIRNGQQDPLDGLDRLAAAFQRQGSSRATA